MTGVPEFINGVYADVATAPEPVLSITGPTGLITNVRFVWTRASCGWCRQHLRLFTDGGTIEAGIETSPTRRRSSVSARWYTIYRPASAPTPPKDCPNPVCPRPPTTTLSTGGVVPTGWLMDSHTLSAQPVHLQATNTATSAHPAHPTSTQLVNQVWATLRSTHPDLAAAADKHDRERLHRQRDRGAR